MIERAITVMCNPHSTNIKRLRDDFYAPTNLTHVTTLMSGLDHESWAIEVYHNMTYSMVKLTGIWMLRNNTMGASREGLLFTEPHSSVLWASSK